jgi:hypothetical protein
MKTINADASRGSPRTFVERKQRAKRDPALSSDP